MKRFYNIFYNMFLTILNYNYLQFNLNLIQFFIKYFLFKFIL